MDASDSSTTEQVKCGLWGCGRYAVTRVRIQVTDWAEPRSIDVCDYHDMIMRDALVVKEKAEAGPS